MWYTIAIQVELSTSEDDKILSWMNKSNEKFDTERERCTGNERAVELVMIYKYSILMWINTYNTVLSLFVFIILLQY